MYTDGLKKLINSIDNPLGRDLDDLNMFEYLVDNHYESIFKSNEEYFKERPDLLSINNEQVVYEMNTLIEYFIKKEEYEKCKRLQILIGNYQK
jgi:hypothetical protein